MMGRRQIERRASYRNRSATMGDLPQVMVVKKKKPKAEGIKLSLLDHA